MFFFLKLLQMSDIEETEVRGGQGQVLDPETYRDSIGTMEQSGKRNGFSQKTKRKIYQLQKHCKLCFTAYLFCSAIHQN
jgi:hypothetical protein